MTTQHVAGLNWKSLGEKLKRHWGLLTDADIERADQNVASLAGIIQNRTGRERDEIQRFLDSAVEECTSELDRISENARKMVSHVGTACADALRPAGEMVFQHARSRPYQAVCEAFGLGILVGAVAGLLIRQSE